MKALTHREKRSLVVEIVLDRMILGFGFGFGFGPVPGVDEPVVQGAARFSLERVGLNCGARTNDISPPPFETRNLQRSSRPVECSLFVLTAAGAVVTTAEIFFAYDSASFGNG